MSNSATPTFRFSIQLPQWISLSLVDTDANSDDDSDLSEKKLDREAFYEWLWARFGQEGLLGIHEGTLLSEQAHEKGLEAKSWTIDSAEAPRGRDWVGDLDLTQAELYFASEDEAAQAIQILKEITSLSLGSIERQEPQDWDAQWKASFLEAGAGVEIPPFWRIVPPWVEASEAELHVKTLKINPGAGFGTGTHETTQLCLEAIGNLALTSNLSSPLPFTSSLNDIPVLDFGSGSGILAIGMAILGARVDAVEVDSLAIDNARENAALNHVENRISYAQSLPTQASAEQALATQTLESYAQKPLYRIVVANILRPVLIEFAEQLVSRLETQGTLILSGLIESDVEPVLNKYLSLLGQDAPERIYSKNEWRAITFKKA
jgi:ribosomal protein L11 methyltransferase